MINIDQVRVSFKNYPGTQDSAHRVARLTMERLEQMSAEGSFDRGTHRIVDRVVCDPLRISTPAANEVEIAEFAAAKAWQTILGRI
jgi:hypothetical protein